MESESSSGPSSTSRGTSVTIRLCTSSFMMVCKIPVPLSTGLRIIRLRLRRKGLPSKANPNTKCPNCPFSAKETHLKKRKSRSLWTRTSSSVSKNSLPSTHMLRSPWLQLLSKNCTKKSKRKKLEQWTPDCQVSGEFLLSNTESNSMTSKNTSKPTHRKKSIPTLLQYCQNL